MKNAFYSLKKETSNYSKCSAFASSVLFHLFFNSNSVSFVEGWRNNISCPRAQGILASSYATVLIIFINLVIAKLDGRYGPFAVLSVTGAKLLFLVHFFL